jgi:hypothetical protein
VNAYAAPSSLRVPQLHPPPPLKTAGHMIGCKMVVVAACAKMIVRCYTINSSRKESGDGGAESLPLNSRHTPYNFVFFLLSCEPLIVSI